MRYIDEDGTIYLYFTTVDGFGEPVAPSSAFTTSDVAIHKNGSATQKTSTNGLTMTSPFDSKTGLHLLTIDTSNDTGDAGFWTEDGAYKVRFETSKTVDGKSIDGMPIGDGFAGEFTIRTELTAADVNAQVDTALAEIGLDHLLSAAVTGTDVTDNSIIAKLVSASATADWDDFVNTTDSMQALRDWIGNGANLTEAGGTGDQFTAIGWNAAWDAEVQSEVADALAAYNAVATTDLPSNFSLLSIDGSGLVSLAANQSGVTIGIVNTMAGTITTLDALDTAQDAQHATTQSAVSSVGTNVSTLLTRIPAALFSGITSLANWLGVISGKTADAGTLAEINATTAGAGFDNSTDSLEAQRDWIGNGSNLTEAGGTGDQFTAIPWNAAWDTEVQSEVADALTAYNAVATTDLPTNFGDLSISATTGLVSLAADQSGVTIGTVTTNTDMRGTDNALLASSAPSNFSDLAITVTTGLVSVGTNNDKTGYSISGSKTTLDALNDIAATDVVSGGAITTSGGAVSNVTLVATTTTNSDMRGTDNALLASSAPTNFGDLAITATTGKVTVGTNDDKTGYSLSADQSGVTIGTVNTMAGTIATLDALDTAQDAQHATTQAAISALENLSSADVATALATYDGPTKTEMDAAFTEIKGATWNSATDTLEQLQIIIAAVKTVTDAIPDAGAMTSIAQASALATVDTVVDGIQTDLDNATDGLGALKAAIDTLQATATLILADTNELQTDWVNGGRLDLLLDAIKAVTDALPDSGALTSLAQASALATVDTVVDGIQTDLDNATDGLGAIKTLIDTLQTTATAIKAITDNIPDSGAMTSIAQGSAVATVDTVVDGIQTDLDNATDGLGALKTAITTLSSAMTAAFTEIKGATWNSGTDTLEAISDGAGGGGGATAAEIADAVMEELVADHSGVSGSLAEAIANINTNVTSLIGRIPAALFSGITSLASWLGIIAGKSADASTLAELNATNGGLTYNNTTESLEGILDRGNAAWSGNGSVTVVPYSATSPTRVRGTNIFLFVAETIPTAVTIYDASDAEIDLSAKTLVLTIDLDGEQVQSETPTVSGGNNSIINFTPVAAVTVREQSLDWSLRDTANANEVVAYGKIIVSEAPLAD